MNKEFKYIPYSPDDEHIRGLVKYGNVYNLNKNMLGILLPDGVDNDLREAEQDLQYMKEMYPGKVRLISTLVEDECDKLEYADSPMLVEYPDPEFIRKMAKDINNKLDIPEAVTAFNDQKDSRMLRNLIETLICNEFYCRRQRYRRCRRKFYL